MGYLASKLSCYVRKLVQHGVGSDVSLSYCIRVMLFLVNGLTQKNKGYPCFFELCKSNLYLSRLTSVFVSKNCRSKPSNFMLDLSLVNRSCPNPHSYFLVHAHGKSTSKFVVYFTGNTFIQPRCQESLLILLPCFSEFPCRFTSMVLSKGLKQSG